MSKKPQKNWIFKNNYLQMLEYNLLITNKYKKDKL